MTSLALNPKRQYAERDFHAGTRRPSAASVQARRAAEERTRRERAERQGRRGVWWRLALVLVLCVAIVFWPYAVECGTGLYAYLGAESMIVIGGLWVAGWTWRQRMPVMHGVALVVALWGLALAGHQVLVRTGYVHVEAGTLPVWTCG